MKLIPFKEICEDDEFWGGARFIKKGTGLRKLKSEEDFFEYMLINDLGSSEWMICTHIDSHEAGSVISHVRKTTSETNRHTVSAKEFKRSNILDEDLDNWYYQYVDHDRYWTQNQYGLLERLKKIDFHDLPLNHMSINYDYQSFSIGFEIYNEVKEDYDSFILKFENLKELKIGGFLSEVASATCSDAEI